MRKYKGLEVALESALNKVVEADKIKDSQNKYGICIKCHKTFKRIKGKSSENCLLCQKCLITF